MTSSHKRALLDKYPACRSKVKTLAEVSEGAVSGDVDDPIGLGQQDYERTAEMITRGLSVLAERLRSLGSLNNR